MLPQELNLTTCLLGWQGLLVHPVLPEQWELFNLLSPTGGESVQAMASAPHPSPRLGLGPQTEVLLSLPPGRETGPALSQGQAWQGHSDLEPAAGLFLSSWREEKRFLCSPCPGGPAARKATQGQVPLVTSHPSCVPESLGRMRKYWPARKWRRYPAVAGS